MILLADVQIGRTLPDAPEGDGPHFFVQESQVNFFKWDGSSWVPYGDPVYFNQEVHRVSVPAAEKPTGLELKQGNAVVSVPDPEELETYETELGTLRRRPRTDGRIWLLGEGEPVKVFDPTIEEVEEAEEAEEA